MEIKTEKQRRKWKPKKNYQAAGTLKRHAAQAEQNINKREDMER